MQVTNNDETLRASEALAEQPVHSAPMMLRAPSWVWSIVAYLPVATAAPALALGVSGLAGRGPLRHRRGLAGVATVAGAAMLVKWQLERLFSETPDYEVEQRIGDIEIRRYPPRIVAETVVELADEDEARSEGFRRLAGYIFGGNVDKREIAMTAPVSVQSRSAKIDMTSPVTVTTAPEGHTVTFTMPRKWNLATLPAPRDSRVELKELPASRVAVLTYRGTYRGDLTRRKQAELSNKVRAAGLVATGAPVFAGYDAPSTLPFLRHIEAWVPLADR